MSDAESIAAICAPFVTNTSISFEEVPPGAEEIAARIKKTTEGYPYFVAEENNQVIAYAYAGAYRARHAYRFTAEVSVYTAPEGASRGLAAELYRRVLSDLYEAGFHSAVAIITLPNDKSVTFHERHGFEHIGTIAQVGYKSDRWHDTGIWQYPLISDRQTRKRLR